MGTPSTSVGTARRVADLRSRRAKRTVAVWDRFVRFFHWMQIVLLGALFVSAHLGQQELHVTFGNGLALLVLTRLAWGVIGPEYARFENFVTGPGAALRYLVDIVRGHPRRYLGHNPAGAWMVLALLAAVLCLLGTGFALQATLEFDGPLVGLLRGVSDRQVRWFVLLHAWALDALYVLVPLHLLGVLLASRQHGENLVGAMITGDKPLTTER